MKLITVTNVLIVLCIAAFYFSFFVASPEPIFSKYGFSVMNFLERPYVIVTSIFLHAGLAHLLSNILVLFFFGSAVEPEIGKARTLLIFFLGAIAGDAFSSLFYSFDAVAIGASAGVFALVGAGILVKPFELSYYPYMMPVPLALLGIMYAVYNIYGFFALSDNISYAGHFGGLFVGLLFGLRRKGMKKSALIIMLMLALMTLIPVAIKLLTGFISSMPA